MPTDPPYYTPDVPDDQKETVKAITDLVCCEDGIEFVFPLLTNFELPQELVVNESNLSEVTSLLPETELLKSLVSQHPNTLIIPLWRVNLDEAIRGERRLDEISVNQLERHRRLAAP
jgi:hypothetical protein